MKDIVVVGAGLAGLTVAKLLAERGFRVTVLEATERPGGKAGADLEAGEWREHGYHIFPAWYANTRPILDGLGLRLIDFDRWHYVEPGRLDRPMTMRVPDSLPSLVQAMTGGLLPWHDTVLYWYFVLDMLAEPLSRKAILDQVSRLGLMRSRWYMTDGIPELEQENVLKASAIPVHDMSAMTAKIISAYWVRAPLPFLSILPGDLQTTFIEPYAAQVQAAGAQLRHGEAVVSLDRAGAAVGSVTSRRSDGTLTRYAADIFVLTTPLEVARKLIGGDVQALDPDLGDFEHLPAAPMAALHLDLGRKLPNVPREHVFLHKGRYGLSFIDVSQHWAGGPNTRLSFISSNFVPLRDLTPTEQYGALLGEISHYLGISAQDVGSYSLKPNVEVPLFINTVGAWPNRPGPRARHIPNLYFAGDWAKNQVDLACMEGAVCAAIEAARKVAEEHGAPAVPPPLRAKTYPEPALRVLKWLLAPAMLPVWLAAKLSR